MPYELIQSAQLFHIQIYPLLDLGHEIILLLDVKAIHSSDDRTIEFLLEQGHILFDDALAVWISGDVAYLVMQSGELVWPYLQTVNNHAHSS